MASETATTALRQHVRDVLRRARSVPIGSGDRQDLRQLAIGLRWLERHGRHDVQQRVANSIIMDSPESRAT